MWEKLSELAERVASRAGVSRRGFLDLVGRRALGLAGVLAGLAVLPANARARPGGQACLCDEDCACDEYCATEPGDCGGKGICLERPEICYDLYFPVCGCDGLTYANECYAAREGVNVAYYGECEGEGGQR
jgi:hypothetical protein